MRVHNIRPRTAFLFNGGEYYHVDQARLPRRLRLAGGLSVACFASIQKHCLTLVVLETWTTGSPFGVWIVDVLSNTHRLQLRPFCCCDPVWENSCLFSAFSLATRSFGGLCQLPCSRAACRCMSGCVGVARLACIVTSWSSLARVSLVENGNLPLLEARMLVYRGASRL